jgi:hypothetical protein
MPVNRKEYHPKWKLISKLVRFRRAQGRCEKCGVQEGQVGYYVDERFITATLPVRYYDSIVKQVGHRKAVRSTRARYHVQLVKIKTSCAHLDHNRKNNRFSNLAALCERCHLRHDIPERTRTFKYGIHFRKNQLNIPYADPQKKYVPQEVHRIHAPGEKAKKNSLSGATVKNV